jgi:hypothetical protein
MFLDDELGLDDKIEFLEKVHADKAFKDETIELLRQEKLIRADVVDHVPSVDFKIKRRYFYPILRPVGLIASTVAAVIIILFFVVPSRINTAVPYRFVIYRPDANQVEITGSFTAWKRIPMRRMGSSGYWEITLNLSKEEHRFTYILEGRQSFADPTVLTREHDDFGGENSILFVNGRKT